jgi:ankyrin repeat protein
MLGNPTGMLDCFVRVKSVAKTKTIFQAFQWVASAFRALTLSELFEALTTDVRFPASRHDYNQSSSGLSSGEDLIETCTGILEIKEDGVIGFCNKEIKDFILSPDFVTSEICQIRNDHEMIAAVCIRHLDCLDRETIFQPWISTRRWLSGRKQSCHLRSYSTAFWHEHYRIAESSSRYLPAMLHRTISSAFAAQADLDKPGGTSSHETINEGLRICAQYDFKIIGKTYLEMGADVYSFSILSRMPLHSAVANASKNMAKLLLDRDADPTKLDGEGMTPLHLACALGNVELVSMLLQYGADIDARAAYWHCCCYWSRIDLQTSLHIAASHGYVNIVEILLEAGSDVNAVTTSLRKTALHLAVEHAHEAAVRHLLEWGAAPEAETANSRTALQIAIEGKHDSIIKLLFEYGAKLRAVPPDSVEYLVHILSCNDLAIAVPLLESVSLAGSDVPLSPQPLLNPKVTVPSTVTDPTAQETLPKLVPEDTEEEYWQLFDKLSVILEFW